MDMFRRRPTRYRIAFAVTLLVALACVTVACGQAAAQSDPHARHAIAIVPVCAIQPPAGYTRVRYDTLSYAGWLQSLPLRLGEPGVRLHDGTRAVREFYRIRGVLNLPLLFKQDLEQCADWAMRLWAEYHLQTGRTSSLYLLNYGGNAVRLSESGRQYRAFLKWAFANANAHSLKAGCLAVAADSLRPGDMFVQNEGGGVGHVSVVMDKCVDSRGQALYQIGYSFMPAQEFHLETAADAYGVGGWFTASGFEHYLADNLALGAPLLRRWKDPGSR